MDLILLMYIFGSAVLVSGGAFSFYTAGEEITAGIFFVGMLVAVVFFGLRWFTASGAGTTGGPWPPVINHCPDFLTLSTVNGEQVCIDTIGVAQAGGIARWSDPTQTDERYLFHLFLNTSGADRINKVCAQAQAKKVSWEGIWDGSVCMGVEPPAPPTK